MRVRAWVRFPETPIHTVAWATAWTSVFAWIMTQGALGLGLWGLLVTAAVAGVSYLVLRRATP